MSYSKRKKSFIDQKILLAIDRLTIETKRTPTVYDVLYNIDVKAIETVKRHIREMTKTGLTEWEVKSGIVWLTTKGKKLARQQKGQELVRQQKGDDCLAIYMPDNTMAASGILEGDTLEIQKSFPLCDGMLVAARMEEKLTCRKLSVQGTQLWLYTENAPEDALETSAQDIVGVVSKVQRLYYNFSA